MKIINSRIMAQSVVGSNNNNAALLNDPCAGAGWNLFAFSGKLPTSKEGFDAAFNSKSLADMYNKAIGFVRSPISAIENGITISMPIQSQYIPKGISYYGTIGSANIVAYQLVPHRIVRSSVTDRNITVVLSGGTTIMPTQRFAPMDIDIEFDTPVSVKYIKYNGSPTGAFSLVAVSDSGVETTLGTSTQLAGDANCRVLSAPVASKKYRYKYAGGNHISHTLLTDIEQPSSQAQTAPTWAALAHCNTFTHGDIDYSDEIMFCAAAVGNQGPFKIVGDVIPNKKTTMYCPKLRFLPRSN